jgi:ribulose-5-phosphate 4-epimerase/fuculose-1-phosphate aldolase
MTVSHAAERRLVALACRVLAIEGLVETTLGHVSLRVDDRHLLVRARRASEHGLLFTTPEDIALVDLDGNLHSDDPPISLPSELPIHTALLASRPDCGRGACPLARGRGVHRGRRAAAADRRRV